MHFIHIIKVYEHYLKRYTLLIWSQSPFSLQTDASETDVNQLQSPKNVHTFYRKQQQEDCLHILIKFVLCAQKYCISIKFTILHFVYCMINHNQVNVLKTTENIYLKWIFYCALSQNEWTFNHFVNKDTGSGMDSHRNKL